MRGAKWRRKRRTMKPSVVRQVGLHQPLAVLARTAPCRWRGRSASCGSARCGCRDRPAISASTSGSAARVSPTDTACTQSVCQPAPRRAVEAEPLAQVLRGSPAPRGRATTGAPAPAAAPATTAASTAARIRLRPAGAAPRPVTSATDGGAPWSPRLTMRGDQLPSVFHFGESQYSSMVGRTKAAAMWVRPVSTPIASAALRASVDRFIHRQLRQHDARSAAPPAIASASRFSPAEPQASSTGIGASALAGGDPVRGRPLLGVARGAVEEHGVVFGRHPVRAVAPCRGRAGRSRARVSTA